jgi:hypothetical protein
MTPPKRKAPWMIRQSRSTGRWLIGRRVFRGYRWAATTTSLPDAIEWIDAQHTEASA